MSALGAHKDSFGQVKKDTEMQTCQQRIKRVMMAQSMARLAGRRKATRTPVPPEIADMVSEILEPRTEQLKQRLCVLQAAVASLPAAYEHGEPAAVQERSCQFLEWSSSSGSDPPGHNLQGWNPTARVRDARLWPMWSQLWNEVGVGACSSTAATRPLQDVADFFAALGRSGTFRNMLSGSARGPAVLPSLPLVAQLRGASLDDLAHSLSSSCDAASVQLQLPMTGIGGGGDLVPLPAVRCREDLEALLAFGAKIVVPSASMRWPAFAELAIAAMDGLLAPADVDLTLGCPGSGGSSDCAPRTKTRALLVLQVSGRQQWRVWQPPARQGVHEQFHPFMRGCSVEDTLSAEDLGQPLIEVMLQPGESLMIPWGFPHSSGGGFSDLAVEPSIEVQLHLHDAEIGTYKPLRAALLRRLGESEDLELASLADEAFWGLHSLAPAIPADPSLQGEADGSKTGSLVNYLTKVATRQATEELCRLLVLPHVAPRGVACAAATALQDARTPLRLLAEGVVRDVLQKEAPRDLELRWRKCYDDVVRGCGSCPTPSERLAGPPSALAQLSETTSTIAAELRPDVVKAKSVIGDCFRICIVGGEFHSEDDQELVEMAAKRLSQGLASRACFITSCMAGVQQTFAESCDNIAAVCNLLPEGQRNSFGKGIDMHIGSDFDACDDVFWQVGEAYVTFESGVALSDETIAADARGALVVPLLCDLELGADGPCRKLRSRALCRREQWSALSSTYVDDAIEAALDIISGFIYARQAYHEACSAQDTGALLETLLHSHKRCQLPVPLPHLLKTRPFATGPIISSGRSPGGSIVFHSAASVTTQPSIQSRAEDLSLELEMGSSDVESFDVESLTSSALGSMGQDVLEATATHAPCEVGCISDASRERQEVFVNDGTGESSESLQGNATTENVAPAPPWGNAENNEAPGLLHRAAVRDQDAHPNALETVHPRAGHLAVSRSTAMPVVTKAISQSAARQPRQ